MALTNEVAAPGDLSEFTISVAGEDITAAVVGVQIYQHIQDVIWSANIYILDTENLLLKLPIRPASPVNITIATSHDVPEVAEASFQFRVMSIKHRERNNTDTISYTLVCVRQEYFLDQNKRISRHFGYPEPIYLDDLAQEIVTELGATLDDEDKERGRDKYFGVIPYWSPLTVCQWIIKTIIPETHNAPDYAFFMYESGKFRLYSLESLFTMEKFKTKWVLKQEVSGLRENEGDEFEKNNSIRIRDYHFDHYNAGMNMQTGYYASKRISHDLINKKIVERKYTFSEELPKDEEMKTWDDELLTESHEAHVTFSSIHNEHHDLLTTMKDQDLWIQGRKAQYLKTTQERLFVQLTGSVAYTSKLGWTLEVELPKNDSMDTENDYDEKYKGLYLIMGISHQITKDSYFVNLELMKKRLEEPL